MSRKEIISNEYKYVVDTSYGINQDGFIAIGTESIVYKGIKVQVDGNIQFSCVLKFKKKNYFVDGKKIDKLKLFKEEEWPVYEALKECRSVVRIDDVIEELGDFTLLCDKIKDGVIDDNYFCVVEEFIDGWSLAEYCKQEYWKLEKVTTIANGLKKVENFQEFTEVEKKTILQSYNYDNIIKYQNQIVMFMINLCDILEYVTEQKNILHLDIKPENIMVTRYGKELVLIDFGRSMHITRENRFVKLDLVPVNYNGDEQIGKMFEHGTIGYAAPECYAEADSESEFPFSNAFHRGTMSIESDIFSFGATFWECLNIVELTTRINQFLNPDDIYDFYKSNFMCDDLYFNRNLYETNAYYSEQLEKIIKKCTKKRTEDYLQYENKNFYHSYAELRKDIEKVKDSAPVIIKEENVKAKNAFYLSGACGGIATVFVLIYLILHSMAFNIASNRWDTLTQNYNETKFSKLEETAKDMIETAPDNQVGQIYDQIAAFTYKDGAMANYEAAMLVGFLNTIGQTDKRSARVDEIMQYANTREYKDISTQIMKLDDVNESVGYDLAKAIYSVEVGNTDIVSAYETLCKYKDEQTFENAVVKLKNVLDNDEDIEIIAMEKGISRQDILHIFNSIGSEGK